MNKSTKDKLKDKAEEMKSGAKQVGGKAKSAASGVKRDVKERVHKATEK
jgi:hypothetical protein